MEIKTKILVIYTGGTIGMVQDELTGTLQPLDFKNIYQQIPILHSYELQIDFHSFDPLIDSSNVQPPFWIKLAAVIEDNYKKYHGFVVLHGTDTMAFTASALSYMLENLNKPVILTGSQLPLGVTRSDGRQNIINSIEIASAYSKGFPVVPEVAICFENNLLRGNRTYKFNAENFKAFLSGNYPHLAEVGVHIKYNENYIIKPSYQRLRVYKNLDSNVVILKIFPGISENIVNSILNAEGLKGVVLETYGAGNAPTDSWFINQLEAAIDKGMLVLNVTQCKQGSVEMGRYETSAELNRIGVIGGYDITVESALTKMMFVLGSGLLREEQIKLLQTSLRGEMTID
ncbi:MAG: type I asparaginase [Bacteroidetes bacterium]|nr:type I asparaginase [Bacteroidota bacterium]